MLLTGLKDDFVHQGRPLWELVRSQFLPEGLCDNEELLQLAQILKQIDAPVGRLGLIGARLSTLAITGNHAQYRQLEAALSEITSGATGSPGRSSPPSRQRPSAAVETTRPAASGGMV